MGDITKSRNSVLLLVAAAGLYAVGTFFQIIAYATFSAATLSSYNTFKDLSKTGDWFHFLGVLSAMVAVGLVVWEMVPRKPERVVLAEAGGAALATLLITIGALVQAASSMSVVSYNAGLNLGGLNTASSGASVIVAIGIGGWALLALSRAVRHNLAEQPAAGGGLTVAQLWLAASGGLVLLAVGTGFGIGATDQTLGIIAGLIEAIGAGLVLYAISGARQRGMLSGSSVPKVMQGLGVATAGFLVAAISAGIVFTSSSTLTQLRVFVSITDTVLLVAIVQFGLAAWARVAELPAVRPAVAGSGSVRTAPASSAPPASTVTGPPPAESSAPPPPTQAPGQAPPA